MVWYTGLQVVMEAMKSERILHPDSGRRDEMKSSARSNVTVIIDASISLTYFGNLPNLGPFT